ncbi:TonB-dependent receptor [Cruoricaptor ignavus]|uniref:TonB-dependent receptor n=1 Tax=Cruoricaptor ignavus TaxID=1118202 RepID=A0A7M1T290_9FLAO|nr:TonB-dependent receptor [Cruoricaptor ignavus]QOR73052.1 TonB-dependent receptor [Cruoricaptor ignavus]
MKGFLILGLCAIPAVFFAQAQKERISSDSIREKQIQEVQLIRRLPVAKEIISVERDLAVKNLGQDLPILLGNQMSVVTTSDAGNGVGYTGFRIRGVGGNAINVMMNGVPYNDSESQGTFFVDVPDLMSSASQVVIQRGVGTSSNGVSAFGASVNVISKDPEEVFSAKIDNSYGSFNTQKYAGEINSGKLLDGKLSLMGRYTKIKSDGYIDRATSNLDSYNGTALFEAGDTRLRFMAFGGKEITYQAWNGIDRETWLTNPKFNFGGAIYNEDWSEIVGFYDNEVDDYKQNHYQLLWGQKFSDRWNLETTLHYTKGKGYFENYMQGQEFASYGLADVTGLGYADFIRKKWLNNDFYGIVSTLYGNTGNLDLNFGLVANQYYGRHYGNVSGVALPQIFEHEYYRNRSVKNEISGFAKAVYALDDFEIFGDLQLRNIDYDTKILLEHPEDGANMDKNWTFFNPKAGISYRFPAGKAFLSAAVAHREPNREDLLANPETKAERLYDYEAGVEKSFGNFSFTANLYYMQYTDQLVLTGAINNVGAFIRENSGKSYRTGVEIGALANISDMLSLSGNLTWSENKNKDYKVETDAGAVNLGNTDISFSPKFIGNLGFSLKPAKGLSFGMQGKYVGSQYLDNTQNDALKLDDFFLADANARYTLPLNKVDLDIKLLVNNIFDKKYVSNGYVYDAAPYYYAQAGTNFLAGVTVKFTNRK